MNQDILKQVLLYDVLTGIFVWKVKPAINVFIGSIAGYTNKLGYVAIRYRKQSYLAHHLAWLWIYNEWPDYLDHKDGNPSNNSIYNLRKANASLNGANRKINKTNKVGFKGVRVTRHGTYAASISANGEDFYLGSYPTAAEANEAYCKKAIELFGAFHREGVAL